MIYKYLFIFLTTFFSFNSLLMSNATYKPLTINANPEKIGFSKEKLQEIDNFINSEINKGFTGAVLLILKDNTIVKHDAYGFAKLYDNHEKILKNPQPMSKYTIFDIASNTKIYATVYALQYLVYHNKIKLNDLVQTYLPDFKDSENDTIKGKNTITIADLLYHRSGFPADPQYHNKEQAKDLYSTNKKETELAIYRTPLEYRPRTKHLYSDVDFMLLGILIEKVTNSPLDVFVENTIYKPLGLENTLMNPLKKGFSPNRFAATELSGNTRGGNIFFDNIRTNAIQGEVQDEKAFYSMEGVSGHAGLFSNAPDLAVLLQLMLNKGTYNGVTLFDENTINKFLIPSDIDNTYALGWRINSDKKLKWMFSSYAPSTTIGHSGWTGVLTLIDYENNLGIILLTNKKHSPIIQNPQKQSSLTTGCNIESKKCFNRFVGDNFLISTYGAVVEKVYEALEKDSQNTVDNK